MQNAAAFFHSFYFDENQYLTNKTAAVNAGAAPGTLWTVADIAAAIAGANMTAWEHFLRHGAFEQAAGGGLGINPSDLFDVDSYYSDKAEQILEAGLIYTKEEIAGAFFDNALDPITHYALYGYAEGITVETEDSAFYGHTSQVDLFRSLYFDEGQYLANKTAALNAEGVEGKAWTVTDTAGAFALAGLTVWEHFSLHGAFERSADGGLGINPGEYFDVNRYYEDKAEQVLKDTGAVHTGESLMAAFQQNGLDPVTHYALHGYLEGIAPVMENLPFISGAGLSDVPLSGNALIDSLLFTGWYDLDGRIPLKNWNEVGATQDNVIYYTYPESSDVQEKYLGKEASEFSSLNEAQKAGYEAALDAVTDVTGIKFQYTSDPDQANLYFFTAEYPGDDDDDDDDDSTVLGWAKFSSLYSDKVAVILSSESIWEENADPRFGNPAFLTVIHELGHALGLKHPFNVLDPEDDWAGAENLAVLSDALDTEAWTVMSYTDPGKDGIEPWYTEGTSYYAPLDLLALNYLYGTDGLNGIEGIVYATV